MFIRTLVVSALALAATACKPLCHKADKDNWALVAESGGERGVPLYCGYANGANCFYGVNGGDLINGPPGCPDKSLGQCPNSYSKWFTK